MKKYLKVVVMVVFLFVTGLNVYKAQTDVRLSDAQLKNVEALASGEGDNCSEWVIKKCYKEFSKDVGDDFYATCGGNPTVSGGMTACGASSIYEPKFFTDSYDCLSCVK